MGSFEPSGLIESLRIGGGEVTLWFPGGDMVAARVGGDVGAPLARSVYDEIDRYAAVYEHPGRGFIDLSALTRFDWEARAILIRWNVAHRLKASGMDLLTDSWVFQLATRSLTRILGDRLVVHSTRASFETAYATALARSHASSSMHP